MAAQTQPAPPQDLESRVEAAFEEQERLRATLSPEEYEALRQQHVEKLIRLTGEMGKYAESQGMNDEVFAQLLAED
jgi:DNA polymerase II large subunit